MPEDPSTGELYRIIQQMRSDFVEWRREVRDDIQSMKFVHQDVYAADMSALREDVKAIRDERDQEKASRRSLTYLVIGTVILSPIGSILTFLLLRK